MWIRSQDRQTIMNCTAIKIGGHLATEFVIWGINERCDNELGIYPTETEALRVLDEIQSYIADGQKQIEKYPDGRQIISQVVFQMPEAGFSEEVPHD